jgi:hypothetical protein
MTTLELNSAIAKINYYSLQDFERDVKDYIKAITERSMLCVVKSVSRSGMSRVLSFHSYNGGYYRQYNCLFMVLGFKESSNRNGFKINGCGMDMIFHTNYTIIHSLCKLGYVTKEECEVLAQQTPVCL